MVTGMTDKERMDKELEQFKYLCEYGYSGSYSANTPTPTLKNEAGDEEEEKKDQQGQNQGAPIDNTQQQPGEAPVAPPSGAPANGENNPDANNASPEMPTEEPAADNGGGEGNIPALDATDIPNLDGSDMAPDGNMPDGNMPNPEVGAGDTVVDIDQLTDAQQSTNDKVNMVGNELADVTSRINKLSDSLEAVINKIDSNNTDIEALRSEFEKRNPTEVEKLELRYKDSYPFNVKPDDYFNKVADDGRYELTDGNKEDEENKKKYVITKDDIDNPANDAEISKSFDIEIEENYHYDINRIFALTEDIHTESGYGDELFTKAESTKGKMIVYHFSNGSGTVGINVANISTLIDGSYLFVDNDGHRAVALKDVESLINHNPKSPSADLYNDQSLRDKDGFAVLFER